MNEKKILIVDDDADFAEAIKILLESKKYQVLVAPDPTAGLAELEKENPDLLILDVMMENKAAGFIFSRQLRKDPRFAKLPIIMLTGMREATGFSFPGEAKHPTFLPVDDFLEKPVDAQVLLERIQKLLAP